MAAENIRLEETKLDPFMMDLIDMFIESKCEVCEKECGWDGTITCFKSKIEEII